MAIFRRLCSVLLALCCIFCARSALAAAPDGGYRVVRTTAKATVLEVGLGLSTRRLATEFGEQFMKSTGTDLNTLAGLEKLQALNPKTTIPVCQTLGNGPSYEGAEKMGVWTSCPANLKALWLIAGLTVEIPIVKVEIETFAQRWTRLQAVDACADTACLAANLKNSSVLTALKTIPATHDARLATPVPATVTPAPSSSIAETVLTARIKELERQIAATTPTPTQWHSNWEWFVAAIVFFLAAAVFGYFWDKEREANHKLLMGQGFAVARAETLRENLDNEAENGRHLRNALDELQRKAEIASEEARELLRTKEEELATTVGLLEQVQATNAHTVDATERENAKETLAQGRAKIVELFGDIANIVKHLLAQRFTLDAKTQQLKKLSSEDTRRPKLEESMAANEEAIARFTSSLTRAKDVLTTQLDQVALASTYLTGQPQADMQLVMKATSYLVAMEDELAAARKKRADADLILTMAKKEQETVEAFADRLTERANVLDERERAIQTSECDHSGVRVSILPPRIRTVG